MLIRRYNMGLFQFIIDGGLLGMMGGYDSHQTGHAYNFTNLNKDLHGISNDLKSIKQDTSIENNLSAYSRKTSKRQ